MNIVLIGFMGSGKSCVARELGKNLQLPVIETDELVLARSQKASVNEIFEQDGEIHFREMEIEIARDLQDKKNTIIATGGGVIMNTIIIDYLKKNGKIVFLDTSFETIYSRLKGNASRPNFKDKDCAKALYKFRLPLYKKYSDMTISTEDRAPREIARAIEDSLFKISNPNDQ